MNTNLEIERCLATISPYLMQSDHSLTREIIELALKNLFVAGEMAGLRKALEILRKE